MRSEIGFTPGNMLLGIAGVPGGFGAVGRVPPLWSVQALQSATPMGLLLCSQGGRSLGLSQSSSHQVQLLDHILIHQLDLDVRIALLEYLLYRLGNFLQTLAPREVPGPGFHGRDRMFGLEMRHKVSIDRRATDEAEASGKSFHRHRASLEGA